MSPRREPIPEPPSPHAWSVLDLHRIARHNNQRGTMTTQNERPPVMLNCARCGSSTPIHEPHNCDLGPLSPRLRRRLERQEQRNAAARSADKPQPKSCPDCGVICTPGRQHACRLVVDTTRPSQIDMLAAELQRAGYRLVKD